MLGLVDLTGETRGTLRVVQLARRRPEVAWTCTCTVCGTQQTHRHDRLQNGAARCLNAGCGRTAVSDSTTSATVRSIPTAVRSADSAEFREFMRPIEQAERQQREQIEREQAEQAERKAERDAADAKWREPITAEWRRYAEHAIFVWGVPETSLMPLNDWFRIGDLAREKVLDYIAKYPDKPFTLRIDSGPAAERRFRV